MRVSRLSGFKPAIASANSFVSFVGLDWSGMDSRSGSFWYASLDLCRWMWLTLYEGGRRWAKERLGSWLVLKSLFFSFNYYDYDYGNIRSRKRYKFISQKKKNNNNNKRKKRNERRIISLSLCVSILLPPPLPCYLNLTLERGESLFLASPGLQRRCSLFFCGPGYRLEA